LYWFGSSVSGTSTIFEKDYLKIGYEISDNRNAKNRQIMILSLFHDRRNWLNLGQICDESELT